MAHQPTNLPKRKRLALLDIIFFLATLGIVSSVAVPAVASFIERQSTIDIVQSVPRPAECSPLERF